MSTARAGRKEDAARERAILTKLDQVMRTEIDTSEKLLRERLKLIPDGIYRARDFLDHDGHANRLYQIEVAAIKRGDTLTLDMSESSPQAPGFINCTRSGLRGALFTGLLPILAPDIRWNEGVLKPVTITVPEANICNARWPTPVSGATVSTAWVAQNVAVAAISRMVAGVPELVREGQAVAISVDTFPGQVVYGHVNSIAPASGQEFALLPPDNATGNFTKVVQRIPVKIALDGNNPSLIELRPGMSVIPTIETRSSSPGRTAPVTAKTPTTISGACHVPSVRLDIRAADLAHRI